MSPKEKAAPRQENSLQTTNTNYTKPRRAIGSRKAAIEQHCFDCLADGHAPGTRRQQVAECTSKNCALWPFRPTPTTAISSALNDLRDSEQVVLVRVSDGGRG